MVYGATAGDEGEYPSLPSMVDISKNFTNCFESNKREYYTISERVNGKIMKYLDNPDPDPEDCIMDVDAIIRKEFRELIVKKCHCGEMFLAVTTSAYHERYDMYCED
uniref:Uncharacterized protein n=2 Tax=Panagrolaimus sp. JU765 TaxID=591449 RepID=A0AC34Q3B9_9BILA